MATRGKPDHGWQCAACGEVQGQRGFDTTQTRQCRGTNDGGRCTTRICNRCGNGLATRRKECQGCKDKNAEPEPQPEHEREREHRQQQPPQQQPQQRPPQPQQPQQPPQQQGAQRAEALSSQEAAAVAAAEQRVRAVADAKE